MFTVGRPRKYKTDEELNEIIQAYFDDTPLEDWTITGLGLTIGLDRKALIEYGNKEEFSNTIKRAKQLVEYSYELESKRKGHSGVIFGLKNMGWRDKHEVEQTIKDVTVLNDVLDQLNDTD